jgi:hypothetical protein
MKTTKNQNPVLHGNINNAKSLSNKSELNNIDVCIWTSPLWQDGRIELVLNYDNRTKQLIQLTDEQRLLLIELLTNGKPWGKGA